MIFLSFNSSVNDNVGFTVCQMNRTEKDLHSRSFNNESSDYLCSLGAVTGVVPEFRNRFLPLEQVMRISKNTNSTKLGSAVGWPRSDHTQFTAKLSKKHHFHSNQAMAILLPLLLVATLEPAN